jgi:hypothetical protein
MIEPTEQRQGLLEHLEARLGLTSFDAEMRSMTHEIYCAMPPAQLNYGTTITYLLQQIHGRHYPETTDEGYCIYSSDQRSVCPLTIARRPYDDEPCLVVVSPRGPNIQNLLNTLYQTTREKYALPFYIKNPPVGLSSSVPKIPLSPWNKMAPREDDTYPNVVIDVVDILSTLSNDGAVKQNRYFEVLKRIRSLQNTHQLNLGDFSLDRTYTEGDFGRAERVIQAFFDEKEHRNSLSQPEDYYSLFGTPIDWRDAGPHILRAVTTHSNDNKKDDLGLVMAERIANTDSFGVYATLGRRQNWQYTELQMVLVMEAISQLGAKFADIGGAEVDSLQVFHLKFVDKAVANDPRHPSPRQPVGRAWLQFA